MNDVIFKDYALGKDCDYPFSGCDGGDVGSSTSPSIWVFGLEWGWSKEDQKNDHTDAVVESDKMYKVKTQLRWPLNRQVFKLLAAIDAIDPRQYEKFSLDKMPFEQGCKGYFKGNLFPLGFNNVREWPDEAVGKTGFANKAEYYQWMRENRVPVINDWIKKYKPRIFIGLGTSFQQDFLVAAGAKDYEEYVFDVNGHKKRIVYSHAGDAKVVVVPHPTGGPYGLNSYESIRITGKWIRDNFLT